MKAVTPKFRVSYPSLFTPKKNDLNGKTEFSVVALFKKGENLEMLTKAAQAALVKKFGADKTKWPENIRSPFRDQKERAKNVDGRKVLPDGYEEGAIFMNLKSMNRPGVVGPDMVPVLDEQELYAGCYARASVMAYAYDIKGNRGVSFGLQNVQKVADGDTLSGRSKVEEDFAPIADSGTDLGTMSASDLFA